MGGMLKMIFFVQGHPKATPRVKACRQGASARVYTPKTADDWKYCVKQVALAQIERLGSFEDEPLELRMSFYLPRPKSHYNKKGLKETAPVFCSSKPDCDNLTKAVMDALTDAGMWRDDAQVARITCEKLYVTENHENRDKAGCRISITSLP